MNKSSVFVLLVVGCLAIVPTPVLMQTGGKSKLVLPLIYYCMISIGFYMLVPVNGVT